ncbi:PREDICTED: uncharacterized protein LOC107163966 [Diuraphis noxia]|uniref:uncharacterized protein LOC107163966 n=1 Tax=Diuraphis noxia TaxID=143948 RepID=UPI000763A926|nr:PREDICTED: uncharacterized protein LOC107163966 [Diuraphis noxia]
MYTVEWQKRGLPHVHLLVWLNNKLRPNAIDLVLSAVVPNQREDTSLFNIVSRNMIHAPCDPFNMNSPCMQNGKCLKGFPKLLTIATQSGQDGYPKYRVDHRMIVGSDQAAFSVESRDEIKAFQNGRYISSSEAAWWIFGFTIHERSPAIFQLSVHLENGQRVYFTDQNARERLENVRNTTIMAFFELCSSDDFAKTLLYIEVPSYYTFTYNRFNRTKQDLKTVDDVIHRTFQRACKALGLLQDENHWNSTLEEAALFQTVSNLRELFVTMIEFCHISNSTVGKSQR